MNILESIGRAICSAVQSAEERSKRAAALNRVRTVIDVQERAAQREYLALGRYYYNTLRDREDQLAEGHCAQLDQILQRQDRALNALEELYQAQGPEEACPAADGEREEVTLEDVEVFDADPALAREPAPEEPVFEDAAPEESVAEAAAPEEPAFEDAVPEEPAADVAAPEEPAAEAPAPEEPPVYSRLQPEEKQPAPAAEEPDENDDLPFEG